MLPSRKPTTVTGTTLPSGSKYVIMPSLVPMTPMPASMLMKRRPREGEEGREKRERRVRDEEGKSEEVKVGAAGRTAAAGGRRRRWTAIVDGACEEGVEKEKGPSGGGRAPYPFAFLGSGTLCEPDRVVLNKRNLYDRPGLVL